MITLVYKYNVDVDIDGLQQEANKQASNGVHVITIKDRSSGRLVRTVNCRGPKEIMLDRLRYK